VVASDDELNAGADAISVDSNAFTVGATTRNKKKGTATVSLTLPNAGDVTVSGKGVKGRVIAGSSTAAAGGSVNIVVKARGKKRRQLNETGKAGVRALITFTPPGLSPNTRPVKLGLKKKLKG
jgi:hypothetical protein